ncbi:phenolic glucoside malonyltransferase 1 [Cajanus cajan]|uniref:Anthocyanin 5-aromatic acyltransferase n=1 Tax=Cajanus cajan TaxID=3821 RepID=A0A151RY47_CAJCA|nr:phenolic glucoside malonyltransferase 1 [Cajanus cajan]KYP47471.1 Anthocyanin 5-aromatic acyltransferase [Cajanus cajan]
MASGNIKIYDHSRVSPPTSTLQTSLSLTFFDLFWLRLYPVERIFFYTLPTPLSHPSTFFNHVVPTLKTSLSHTLQHFPALAGNLVWPSGSPIPLVKYTLGDTISFVVAQSEADFDQTLDNSPRNASESRALVPHLESSDSHAEVLSLQITLFPNRGFTIGISTHHAVLDGKSSTLFVKAWSSLCKTIIESESEPIKSPPLVKGLQPFFDRTVIKPASELGLNITEDWTEILAKRFPQDNGDGRCLKLLPSSPRIEDADRATFVLTRADLEKLKKRVLSKWELESKSKDVSKPATLSSFVVTVAYALVCIAGSNRFGVYETDFGWGKPAKVEIASVDRAMTIGLAESKDAKGGVEVGLVLNKDVMDLFRTLFHEGLSNE